ncbi:HNH endonuclease family protein [Agromyces bauzanensis]
MSRRNRALGATLIAAAVAAGALALGPLQALGADPSASTPTKAAGTVDEIPAHAPLVAAGLVDEQTQHVRTDAVRDLLEQLVDAEPVNASSYERDSFGQRWADIDRNGCDSRNDLLSRDLTDVQYKPGTHACVVLAGTLNDPYTGTTLNFTRGQSTSELVPIDHVIPLAYAHAHGAAAWAPEAREQFANDPLNLQATTREANSSKSDQGPAAWLPSAADYQCTYVARFTLVATTYQLTIAPADVAAITTTLDRCAE